MSPASGDNRRTRAEPARNTGKNNRRGTLRALCQAAPSSSTTTTTVRTGWRAIRAPMPAQTRDSSRPAAPCLGIRGQKANRPVQRGRVRHEQADHGAGNGRGGGGEGGQHGAVRSEMIGRPRVPRTKSAAETPLAQLRPLPFAHAIQSHAPTAIRP